MCAIETSQPRTAPAKAAGADAMAMSAIPADMLTGAVPHAEYRLGIEQFRNRGFALQTDSEGAAVR